MQDVGDSLDTAGTTDAYVDPNLESASGTKTVVLRLVETDLPATATRAEAISKLKTHARETQSAVREFDASHTAVDIKAAFWITNAVVVEVDTDKVSIDRLAELEHVRAVHQNFEVQKGETERAASSSAGSTGDHVNTTYGLDQINATEVWADHNTRGGGVKVAVLDTGVNVSHPDIDLFTRNASDPTYPGGYAEWDAFGNKIVGATPSDEDGHGTHVSGTVAGGSASGEYIGVAPNVSLMHGKVIPEGSGTFAQITAGIQWSVENGADVISMSLGATGKYPGLIEPIENAGQAGVVVVTSTGNSGATSSGSPGNYYNVISVGASDSDRQIASFSSSEFIDTSAAWGADAPEDWPVNYTVPDVAAPGVSVKSSVPGGYAEFDGTSMAAPHVAGTVALILAAADNNPSVDLIEEGLEQTANPAAGLDQSVPSEAIRDGAGIINASAAVDYVASDQNVSARLTEGLSLHAEPGQNTTATFRISNAETAEVDLVSGSDVDPSNVSVWVNGQPTSLDTAVTLADGSTDGVTVTVSMNERYAGQVGFQVAFNTTGAAVTTDTVQLGPTRVHPDPIPAGHGAERFNGSTAIENATAFATPGTTIAIQNGTYDGVVVSQTPGLTLTAAHPSGNVTFHDADPANETSYIALYMPDTTLANVDVNLSDRVYLFGDRTALQGVTSQSSVVVQGATGASVVSSSIDTDGVGLMVSESSQVAVSGVTVDAETGISVALTSNSVVESSTVTASNGPGVEVVASDGVAVRNNDIEGSNVSAGFTGAVVSVDNGLGFGSGSGTASALDTVTNETATVAGETVTLYRFSPQAKGEYGTDAAMQRVLDRNADLYGNVTVEQLRSMNASERRAYAEKLHDQLAAASGSTPAVSDEFDTESHTGSPVYITGNTIEGEAAGLLTASGVTIVQANTITNISYPYYGMFVASGSTTYIAGNHIDNRVGTNLGSESGVYVSGFAAEALLVNNDIDSRTAVKNAGVFTVVQSTANTYRGETAIQAGGLSVTLSARDTLAADVGVHQHQFGIAQLTYTDMTVPATAVDNDGFAPVIAQMNWWGDDRGPSAAQRVSVLYDPFLTAPPSEVASDPADVQQFATDMTMEPGEAYSMAVPGPVEGNLSSMFPSDFQGAVYMWDAESESWVQATGDEKLGALDAVVVMPTQRTRVVVEFQTGGDLSTPGTKQVYEGWNLIGAPQYGDAETAFGAHSASPGRIIDAYAAPESQLFAPGQDFGVYTFGSSSTGPYVSPFEGYWVFVGDNGSVASNVPPGVSVAELVERLNIQSEGSEEPRASVTSMHARGVAG